MMNETVVETKVCKHCQSSFDITQGDLDFYDKISPTFVGQKFQIPTPTLCPDCRQQRRLSFRNERKLYRRICDATQQPIISIYSPDKPYKVYDQKTWWSDSRNPLDYGFDFDFSKNFTENFRELIMRIPRSSLIGANNQNSDYINLTADSKNCYIVIESSNAEDCMYGYWLQRCEFCVDSGFSESCQHCYEIDNCFRCYKCFYSVNCEDSHDCYYSNQCYNCSYCFGCAKLENQNYCIFNEQVTKEEFEEFINSDYDKEQYKTIWLQYPELKQQIKQSENSSGNYLHQVQNCIKCYHAYDAQDCKYGEHLRRNAKDIMDVSTVGRDARLIYEAINTGINGCCDIFCIVCWGSSDMIYCDHCFFSSNCFGCIGLRNKQYCIFNKQYSKEEYEIQVPKIIAHMIAAGERGEFFHPLLSPFGYNETVAQEYFPIAQGELEQYGYRRSTYEAPAPHSDKVINGEDLPSTITEVQDSILQYAIKCEVTGKLFRIQPQELAFYRKHNIPLPRKHPDQRHLERLALRK